MILCVVCLTDIQPPFDEDTLTLLLLFWPQIFNTQDGMMEHWGPPVSYGSPNGAIGTPVMLVGVLRLCHHQLLLPE